MKTLRKFDGETRLQRDVRQWLNAKGRDYRNGWKGALSDLQHGGCISGIVSRLVSYADTTRFYRRHKLEINALLARFDFDPSCLNGWDSDDPLAFEDTNQNLLAWFGFEQAAYELGVRHGY